ncbi:Formylmethanofuran dehydrogenase subunit E [Stigmatella aurantiaca]|uniref:Formylmethanofuran dehydrogenase subunit E n=1 Tax=Stigmatella aurantiaca TaxID=41 RepID=A0A1H7FHC4_STIAU|nr:FmdE family protein [Stigmatella aurantiaca]SEK25421.1 Formylmethanofuran dehydrogenase subunit E [Stigmatella aurantiaca]
MSASPRLLPALVLLSALGCAGSPHAPALRPEALSRVAAVHGGAGPWAVAGYRMGQYALQHLGLPAGSFDLEVLHHSPPQVQFACIADGAAAATGASLGKLNLSLAEVARPDGTATAFRNRATGQSVTLKPAARFFERYLNVPREHLADAGGEVLTLPEAEVFEVVATP